MSKEQVEQINKMLAHEFISHHLDVYPTEQNVQELARLIREMEEK